MIALRSMLLTSAGALILALGSACSPDGATGTAGSGAAPPVVSGAFRGTYEVPVGAELAAAALYDVPIVEWTVEGGVAKLEYDLPLGLVGKAIKLEFLGPAGASAPTGALTGAPGTADCTVDGAAISCLEKMAGLLPLEPDYAVVEQLAKVEYTGPVADRIDVTKRFVSDPIGIIHFDLGAPVDHPDDDASHD